MSDRNNMLYWFPLLERADVLVPRTILLSTEVDIDAVLDGETPDGYDEFIRAIERAAEAIGYPVFLRTGHTSAKHDWSRSCFVPGPESIASGVAGIVEYSMLADFLGLPVRTWAVREFLPLQFTFRAFRGMPIAREFRVFVEDGKVLCLHPYWPKDSIRNPDCEDWQEKLEVISQVTDDVISEAERIASALKPHFDGSWSVDICQHQDGRYFVTDMAEADRSFHWAGCPNEPESQRSRREAKAKDRMAKPEAPGTKHTGNACGGGLVGFKG